MRQENRCREYIKDRETNRIKRCQKCYYKLINNKKLCWTHYNKKYIKYIILIQKIYRGYKCKKIIKNIFIKLPIDLQHKIINYNRSDIYHKKYCYIIYKLIRQRYIICYNLHILPNNTLIFNDFEFINIFDIIYNTYYLYNKYFDLVYCKFKSSIINEIRYLGLNSDYLIKRLNNLSQSYFYEISHNSIQEDLPILNQTYNKLKIGLSYINDFNTKYIKYCETIEI